MVKGIKNKKNKKAPSSLGKPPSFMIKEHPVLVWSPKKKTVCVRSNPDAEKSFLIPLKGVNPTVRKLFFPHYRYENANFVTSGKKTSEQIKEEKGHQAKRKNAYGKKDTSIRHKDPLKRKKKGATKGLRIERQCVQTADWYHYTNCSPQTFWTPKLRTSIAKTIRDDKQRETFNKVCRTAESAVEKFWGVMWKYSKIPIGAQVYCGSQDMGVGTRMDFKLQDALDPKIKYGFELKTGQGYSDECTNTKMNYPFQFLTDSPRNQHYLYSLVTWVLHDLTYPNDKLSDYFLCRIDENIVDFSNIPTKILEQRDKVTRMIKELVH